MPEDVKAALEKGVEAFAADYRSGLDANVEAAFDAMEAGGATITSLPEDERLKWAQSLPNLAQEWAAEVDASGLDASGTVDLYIQKLSEAGEPPLRDWAKD